MKMNIKKICGLEDGQLKPFVVYIFFWRLYYHQLAHPHASSQVGTSSIVTKSWEFGRWPLARENRLCSLAASACPSSGCCCKRPQPGEVKNLPILLGAILKLSTGPGAAHHHNLNNNYNNIYLSIVCCMR